MHFSTLLFAAQVAHAYTVVDTVSPFMYKNIDPIVVPGQYKSHLHSFFGSDAVTLNTNSSTEMQKGCTNVNNANDLSVYWVPTLLYTADEGSTYAPVPVMRFSAYYNLGETEAEVALPQNLMMLAGNSSAQTAAASPVDAKVEWFCEDDDPSITADTNGFPSQGCATHLQTLLYFPSCVNNATLETAYKSSSYGTDNYCPTDMKSMPQLRFSIRYDLRKVLPDGWSGTAPLKLASGNAFSSHGDFINGWTPEAATNMLATTASKRVYSAVTGALPSTQPDCVATDADPENGTGDYAASVKALAARALGLSRFWRL